MFKKYVLFVLGVVVISMLNFGSISAAQSIQTDNQGLTSKQEHIALIAAFTANGDLENLKEALSAGLNDGLTVNEIKEVLVQMYAYCGFPRSLNGLNTFMNIVEERKSRGLTVEVGKEATPLLKNKSSIELGTEIQTYLVGVPVKGPIYNFSPEIDGFLKGHLFGDIFGRDILDYQSREIATISALSSMSGLNPQLQGHFQIGLHVGLTEVQLKEIVVLLDRNVSPAVATNASEVLDKVLNNKAR